MTTLPGCVLLDIEGTVAPISFVTDVMFPYVRHHAADYLQRNWQDDAIRLLVKSIGEEAAATPDELAEFSQNASVAQAIAVGWIQRLMDVDAKTTALKSLQGKIWQAGFESGQLKSELFAEVPEVLRRWHAQGIELRIYSSGSIAAQRLFFGHTLAGDLLHLFGGFYDTTSGGKKEAASYERIARDIGRMPGEILFCSDVVAELDAAKATGMKTALSIRPGNPAQPSSGHVEFSELGELG